MQTISLNLIVPERWEDLSDKQLRYVYQLIADEFNSDELKTLCLLKWSNLKVIGRQDNGSFLLKKGNILFELTPLTLAELLPHLDWLASIPTYPVRLSKINRCHALPADFSEVPFEKFLIADNLYQGYLATQDDSLLDELAGVLYGKVINLKPYERISVFYWMASLKDFFSRRYAEFFQPMAASADGNLLGSPTATVEEAMNAQIRALTKGDITKEGEILSLDTWRALTELNAQAKEYRELNSKINSK
ncbi:MAG: hypothetical protein J1E29_06990 [Duncaniella sp.]|nr:hypothetical protein [Duncaniella sp.]